MKVLSTVASVIALGTSAVDGLKMHNTPPVDGVKINNAPVVDKMPDVPGSPSSNKQPPTRITLQQSPLPVDAEESDVNPEMELTTLAVESEKGSLSAIVTRVKCSWGTDSPTEGPGPSYPKIVLSEKQWRSGYLLGVKLDGHASVLFDDTKTVADIWVNRCFQYRSREAVRKSRGSESTGEPPKAEEEQRSRRTPKSLRLEARKEEAKEEQGKEKDVTKDDSSSTDRDTTSGGMNGGLAPIAEDGAFIAGTPVVTRSDIVSSKDSDSDSSGDSFCSSYMAGEV